MHREKRISLGAEQLLGAEIDQGHPKGKSRVYLGPALAVRWVLGGWFALNFEDWLGPKMKLPHSNGDIHIVVAPKSFLRAGQVHLVFT